MRFQVSQPQKPTPEALPVTCVSLFRSFDNRREGKAFYLKITNIF